MVAAIATKGRTSTKQEKGVTGWFALTRSLLPVEVDETGGVQHLKHDAETLLKTMPPGIVYYYNGGDQRNLLTIEVTKNGGKMFVVRRDHSEKASTPHPKVALQAFLDNLPVG